MLTVTLIDNIIDALNNEPLFASVAPAIRGYSKTSLPLPIDKIYLSVVAEENNSSYFQDESSQYCEQCDLTIRINVFSPTNRDSKQIQVMSEVVCDFISSVYLGDIVSYKIGDLEYDDKVKAFCQPCRILFRYFNCPLEDENGDPTTANIPEGFFCKAHVADTQVHLTAQEKAYLGQPFVVGNYRGTGEAITVELGFKPSGLIVFRYGHHSAVYDSTAGKVKNFTSFSFFGKYNYGLVLTSTGFTASQYESASAFNCMSEPGGYYAYIAFR